MMKLMRRFILLFFLTTLPALATDHDVAGVLQSVLPDITDIVETSYGYRVRTAGGGVVFVNKAPYGYRVTQGRKTTFITKTPTGYRVTGR